MRLNYENENSPSHILDQSGEEALGGQISVVVLKKFLGSLHELHGHELESFVLKSLDDLSAEAALDSVRLDHDEGSLVVSGHCAGYGGLQGLQ